MLFNNQKCRALTLDYVNSAPALELHQFKWLKDDSLIGDLPKHWNHLVDYDKYNSEAALIHYTKGGPYFQEFKDCDYHQDWHSADFDMKYIKVKNDNGKN